MRTKLSIFLAVLVALVGLAAAPALVADGGDSQYEFTGTIDSLPSGGLVGDWTVAGKTVHVTSDTEIEQDGGAPVVGATVRVRGALRADGSVDAKDIEVKSGNDGATEVHFSGVIDAMPASGTAGTWTVGGRTVYVTAATKIDVSEGTPKVGATVEVTGTQRTDGSVDAEEIEVRSGGDAGGTGEGDAGEDAHVFGLVESLPAGNPPLGDWTVAGKVVHVTASTKLEAEGGTFAVGSYVEVEGTLESDGSITAKGVELRMPAGAVAAPKAEFRGTVEVLPATPGWIGDWTVAGKTVHVTAATEIEQDHGTIALGALVEVHGTPQADGSVDADRIELEWGPASTGTTLTNTWILPSSAHKRGQDGSFYTTDLTISNTGASDALVSLRFLGHERDGRTGPVKSLTLAAGATASLTDVLSSLFGIGDDYGALLVSSNVATLVVESTTSTPGAGGEFGQGLRASGRNELVGADRARSLVGVRDDSRFRTNLVLSNAVETAIDVDLNLFAGDGRVLGSLRVHLAPLGMKQVSGVSRALGATGNVSGARLVLSTPTRGGAFAAYASVINNGTNDPRVLSPR